MLNCVKYFPGIVFSVIFAMLLTEKRFCVAVLFIKLWSYFEEKLIDDRCSADVVGVFRVIRIQNWRCWFCSRLWYFRYNLV